MGESLRSIRSFRYGSIVLAVMASTAASQTVQHAEKFPGADAGEKIARCIEALPVQGGICDARELSGQQSVGSGFSVGLAGKPVELLLGPVTLIVSGTLHIAAKSSIVGMPAGAGIGSDQAATVIKADHNAAMTSVVAMDGAMAVLQDITVDGNRRAAPSGRNTIGILVNKANRVEIFRVTAQNSPGYGIELYSSASNESCCAKLTKVMSIANGAAGLHLANTADVFISLSEFENNGTFGIELNNSPTVRIQHSDIGGNALDGIRIYGTADSSLQSHRQMIIGNQFGNNGQHDINIAGFDNDAKKQVSTGNLISSNQFIGSPTRSRGYDAIHIVDSGANTIIGNTFSAPPTHLYRSCIGISGEREGPDQITGNTCLAGAADSAGFTGAPTTVFGQNLGKASPSPTPR